MIPAIVVDDEPYCTEVLVTLLERYCPQVKVVAVCSSAADALKAIPHLQPQLLFLDIEMPQMNGFEMLERLSQIDFHLVFTTSYDQYAIKAIKFSAMDYLLKPIDRDELQKAVQRVSRHVQKAAAEQLDILLQKLHHKTAVNKVALPTMEGLQMVHIDNIIYCESDSNYTLFFLKDKQKLVVSRTLKEIEEMLEEYPFARVHHSYLVNINEINKYVKGEGGYLVMGDGSHIDVSRSKKEALLKKLLHKEQ
jgi:two-component system LytT family response regulator